MKTVSLLIAICCLPQPFRRAATRHYNNAHCCSAPDVDAKVAEYTRTIRDNPTQILGFVRRAFRYRQLGNLKNAIIDLTSAISIEPENRELYEARADIYLRQGNMKAAALDIERSASAARREPFRKYWREVFYYLMKDAGNDTISAWELSWPPLDISPLQRSIQRYASQQPDRGMDGETYLKRGVALAAIGDTDAAAREISEAIRLAPRYPNARVYRAMLFEETRDYKAAIPDYTIAIALDPEAPELYRLRSRIYGMTGDAAASQADMKEATQREEKLTPERWRHDLLVVIRDPEIAVAKYSEAINNGREADDAYFARGFIRLLMGKYDQAASDFTHAVAANSHDCDAYYARGLTSLMSGRLADAVGDLDMAIKIDPTYMNAYAARGLAYSRVGNRDRARTDYQHVLSINPTFSFTHPHRQATAKGYWPDEMPPPARWFREIVRAFPIQ